MRDMKRFVVLFALVAACGGADEVPPSTEPAPTSTGGETTQAEPSDGVQIEGLMGSISQMAVQRGLDPKMGAFMRCFSPGYEEVEVLGGHFHMAFRVDREGNVLWVYPQSSTIGHRAVERCILDEAASIRFSRPSGGEAEFTYNFEVDPPSDVRPATPWDRSRVVDVVDAQSSGLSCGHGTTVTVYVAPGGRVLAAGASAGELDEGPGDASALDCVTEAVSEWEFPDPGSYVAKVSFQP